MLTCPHCRIEICMRELPHPGFFANYRVCPHCEGLFTPDTGTKYRQALSILIAIISLVFTLLLYFGHMGWLAPAIVSYLVLGLIIYWGNKRIFLVPYEKAKRTDSDH